MKKKGKLILISGPSGSGKTTLRNMLLEKNSSIHFSVSYTTRKIRSGETDGKDYFFVSEQIFKEMIQCDEFIEWAKVHENYYGTSKQYVNTLLDEGINVLLEIDVQGGENVLNLYKDLCSVFILPPSIETLRNRFLNRGTEDADQSKIRMENAIKEIEKKELYTHWIVNDNLEESYASLEMIIKEYLKD